MKGVPETIFGQVWLKDSRRIIYEDAVKGALVIVDVDSGRQKEMTTGLHLAVGIVLSPDEKTLYVAISRQQADIWMMTLGGTR